MSDRPLLSATAARRARALCVVVVVGSLVGAVFALALVESFRTTYEDGLELTAQTAAVAGELADPVSGIVADVQELTEVAEEGLVVAISLVENAAVTADEVGVAASTNLADSLDGLARMSRRIADLAERIERFIPGNTESIAEDLDLVAAGLEPAADQLRSLGDTLVTSSDDLETAAATLERTQVVLSGVAEDLTATAASIAELPELAAELERRALEEQDQLGTQVWLLRLLILLTAGTVAAAAGAAAVVLGAYARADAPAPPAAV
jgi:hypothetical protein